MNSFTYLTFQELFESPIRNGVYVPKDERGNGYGMINMGELFAYSRIPELEGLEQVPLEVRNPEQYILRPGDLLFARRSLVMSGAGKCSIYIGNEETNTFESSIIRVRLDPSRADPEYYFYFFNSLPGRHAIETIAEQVAVAGIRGSDLALLQVPYPPIGLQRSVVSFLRSFDDKIELNRQMNTTLEAIARAIFKSWFVDFDPVYAKAEGIEPIGMNAETAALFPDSFEESELGLIPAGWEIRPLDEIANYQNGLALQRYPAEEGEPFLYRLKIRELRQGYFDDKSDRSTTDIREECIVYDGDIIFSWSGSLLIDIWTGGTGALNQHLFKVTSGTYPRWFYYFWTKHHLDEFQRIAAAKATTMGHIRRHHLSEALTFVPPEPLLDHANDILAPYLEAIINNRLEATTLAELRDTLLPRLVSGDIRISIDS